MKPLTIVAMAGSSLLLSGCFGLMAAKKCSNRHSEAKDLVAQLKAEGAPAEQIGGRWTCVSEAFPNQREYWRISQRGNALRIVASTSRGSNFTLEGAISRDKVLWVGKNSGAGAFQIEGDALVGQHDYTDNMSCRQVDITCTRN